MREHHKKREIPLSKPEHKEDVGTGRTLVFEIKYLPAYSKRGASPVVLAQNVKGKAENMNEAS